MGVGVELGECVAKEEALGTVKLYKVVFYRQRAKKEIDTELGGGGCLLSFSECFLFGFFVSVLSFLSF